MYTRKTVGLLRIDISRSSDSKQIEAGWSMEMDETPLSETLPELPKATALYEETQRHWFWASYTLIQEEGAWRIQSMIDEATHAQSLPIEELQRRVQELDEYLEGFKQKHTVADLQQFTEADVQHAVEEMFWRAMRVVGYIDALIKKTLLDRTLYERAAGHMVVLKQLERSLVYLEPLARLFEEERAASLRALAEVQQRLSRCGKMKKPYSGSLHANPTVSRVCRALQKRPMNEHSIPASLVLIEAIWSSQRVSFAKSTVFRDTALSVKILSCNPQVLAKNTLPRQ